MSQERSPHLDALADFMVCTNFKDEFEKPLKIVAKQNTPNSYSLINKIEDWLNLDRGKITLQPRDIKQADPVGMIERLRNGGALISYSVELNLCWRRFVVTKELIHLIIQQLDYDALPNIDTASLLSSVYRFDTNDFFDCYDTKTSDGALEFIALILAEQLLVPWFEHQEIQSSNETSYDLALSYRVPRYIIEEIQEGTSDITKIGARIEASFNERLSQVNQSS